jgi:aminopeptidase N
MLRAKLGDEVFFRAIEAYVETHKRTTVETPDLRKIIEGISGESLEQFFWQWTARPGVPRLAISYSWDEAASSLTTTVEQTQQIDGDNPAFEFTLPLFIAGSDTNVGEGRIESIAVRGKSASLTVKLDQKPRFVAADPRLSLLAEFSIAQDQQATLAQLKDGPTLSSRVQAVRTLARAAKADRAAGRVPPSDVRKALLPVALDANEPVWLRVEATKALVHCGDDVDVLSLSGIAADNWEVRNAAIEGLGSYFAPKAASKDADRSWTTPLASVLENAATTDSSVRVRAAAVRTIGSLRLIDQAGVVMSALAQASQHDMVRQAAIDATASLAAAGLNNAAEMIALFTRDGTISRTRSTAIAALVRVATREGATDPEKQLAFEALAACVRDGDLRTRRSAWSGLRDLGDFEDGRTAKLLETLASESRSPVQKAELQRLHAALVKEASEESNE